MIQSLLIAAAWIYAHSPQLAALMAIAVWLMRRIPASQWLIVERDYPRLANAARFTRSMFPDIVKAWRAGVAVFTGRPWQAVIMATEQDSRTTENPRIIVQPELPFEQGKDSKNASTK